MRKIALVFGFFCFSFLLSKDLVLAADSAPIIETVEAYQSRDGKQCNFFNGCVVAGEDVTINLAGLAFNNGTPLPEGEHKVKARLIGSSGCSGWPDGIELDGTTDDLKYLLFDYTDGQTNFTIPGREIKGGCSYQFEVHLSNDSVEGAENNTVIVSSSMPVQAQCSAEQCNEDLSLIGSYELCAQIKTGTDQYQACADCFSSKGIWTAIGCIPSNPESIIKVVITIGLGLGGGIVLVMILVGAFMLSVSQGDPNKTKEAKEIITSAVIGLLFVIFSVTILQFIGVSILHIPGFGV
jgi:hypothetical protein